jgi:hypothetical protein
MLAQVCARAFVMTGLSQVWWFGSPRPKLPTSPA